MPLFTIISLNSRAAGSALKTWPGSAEFPAPTIIQNPESLAAAPEPPAMVFLCCDSVDRDAVACCRKTRLTAPGLKVVALMPAPPDSESVTRMLEAGADDCLLVPSTREEFLARLQVWNRSAEKSPRTGNNGRVSRPDTGGPSENPLPIPDSDHDPSVSDRQAERLRESEEHYRLLFESNPQPLMIYDLENLRFLAVNKATVQAYGYTREEFLRMTLKDIRPKDDVPALLENVSNVSSRPSDEIDYAGIWRHQLRDGRIIFAEITSHPLMFNRRKAELVLAYDVTERHRMEASLRESEDALRKHERELHKAHELLSFHINNSPLAVVEWDSDFRVSYWSPRAEQLFGWSSEETLGLHPDDWAFVHPDDAGRVGDYMAKLLSGTTTDKLCLNRNFTRDGRTIHCEWYNSVRFDENGKMSSIFSLVDDVTDRIEGEKELANMNRELETRVAERTARLQAVNQELESFCYSVSHDLRAPLRGIDGFAQALQEVPAIQLDEAAPGYLHRVRAAAERMGQLIDDLLQLSRISRHELKRSEVNLSDLAVEIVRDLRQHDPQREVAVEIEPNIRAFGDARLSRIMLENLLSNAWKFTSKSEAPRILFDRLSNGDGAALFRVRDNGVGFDMRYAHKLFSPFQRLHAMSEFPGTGIGLATVKRIVQLHGGDVWAEADPGKGATFTFTLG